MLDHAPAQRQDECGDETADPEVRGIIDGALERTVSLLRERREALEGKATV